MNPQALIATIKINLLRRPLWQVGTVSDCLDMTRDEVMAKIDSGEFAWAFNIAAAKSRSETRILAHCVVENAMGPLNEIGATRNLQLPQVLDLVLPKRDIRSTELKRIFSCAHNHVHQIAQSFSVASKPTATDGPNSFTVYHRASVAKFLTDRRIA